MDVNMIYQNLSQLVFNAIMRGEPREKAMKDAEDTLQELVKRSRNLASDLAKPENAPEQ